MNLDTEHFHTMLIQWRACLSLLLVPVMFIYYATIEMYFFLILHTFALNVATECAAVMSLHVLIYKS